MFCPKCKSEYREGFVTCSDCGVPLVAELPDEPYSGEAGPAEDVEFVEVLATYNAADIAIMKSVLDSASIQYYMLGENFMYVRPLADPVRLMVLKEQVEDVRTLLEDLKLTYQGLSLHGSEESPEDEEEQP
ncbi:MAG: DUF2007 domain-containing protein [Candidatus Eisenbacteria bacterium]